MRDAFGGAFMIKLLIVFIIIYVGFTAVALNYAKAFKAKNAVITYLEEHEISSLENMTAKAENEMVDYFNTEIVGKLNYVFPVSGRCNKSEAGCYDDYGIYIEQIEPNMNEKNKLGSYYRVTTYFGFQLPFFDRLLSLNGNNNDINIIGQWKVIGETRPIAYEKESE